MGFEELSRIQREVREESSAASGCCVILLEVDRSCFSPTGNLDSVVTLHHSGGVVLEAVGAALDQVGLAVMQKVDDSRILIFDRWASTNGQQSLGTKNS